MQAAIATQQSQKLQAVEVRIEDVLRDLKAIATTDLQITQLITCGTAMTESNWLKLRASPVHLGELSKVGVFF